MRLTLVVQNGDSTGKRFVAEGTSLRVGRVAPAEVCVFDDPMLSASHFSIERAGEEGYVIRDLKSRFGTQVNGTSVTETTLQDGDMITAGRTRFRVEVVGGTASGLMTVSDPTPYPIPRASATEDPKPSSLDKAFVLRFLRTLPNLHAVLDAARNPAILEYVKSSGLVHDSLYDGEKGKEIEAFGPWLVALSPEAALLDTLVADGWGDNWGVYLTSHVPFSDIRRQLRRHLLAKLPDGREVYFRYYDPRVLRAYLQTCTPEELASFFGPIGRMVAESADAGSCLVFTPGHKDWQKISA